MKEYVFISGKGGTGKTSFISAFAALSNDCILADCDVDASNLHIILDPKLIRQQPIVGSLKAAIDPEKCINCGQCIEKCRFSAIDEDYNVITELCEGCGVCELVCDAQAVSMNKVVAGYLSLSQTRFGYFSHVKMISGEEGSGKLVTAVRAQAKEMAIKNGKDIILIDGPPGIGCPVIASMVDTDHAIIVCEPSLSGLHDLSRVQELGESLNVPCSVCINKFDVNIEITRKIEDYCKDHDLSILGKIPYDLDIVSSMSATLSIIEYGSSSLTKAFEDIWKNIRDI